MGQAKMHGRRGPPHVTLAGVAAHDVLLSPFLPPGKRLWTLYLRNKSIAFTCCIWNPVVYRVQYYIHFATALMLKPKYDPDPGLANATAHWVGSHDESKSFEIIFLFRSVR